MRVAYIGGNCGEGSAPWATENAYIDAFRSLGHEVTPVKQGEAKAYVGDVLVESDLVCYTRTHNHEALGAPWTDIWRFLEANGTVTASIHLDVFRGLPEREAWVEGGDPLFTTGTVFTADGSAPEWWEARNVNHVWLPPAFDDRHLDVTDSAFADARPKPIEADGKIVFVGSEGYHAAYSFRPRLIQHLRNTYNDRFLFVGDGGAWGKMRMGPLADLYASDAIFVGDHCFATEGRPRYWSDRLPETLGRGGFLVYPDTPGLEDEGFDYDQCLLTYRPGDLDDLDAQIERASLMTAEKRGWIRRWGHGTVLARHTYTHRARTVLDTLGLS